LTSTGRWSSPSGTSRCILGKVPSARLTLNSTKLGTKFKIFRKKKIFFGTKVTLCDIFKHFPKCGGHTSSGRHTN
jgi:hypothetical protein